MDRPCLGMGCCGSKMGKGTFSDHIVSVHNLVSVPNRITSNGKSRNSCIFTQQGRKGINQDAMIVWEVSFFLSLSSSSSSVIFIRAFRVPNKQGLVLFCRILCRKM